MKQVAADAWLNLQQHMSETGKIKSSCSRPIGFQCWDRQDKVPARLKAVDQALPTYVC